MFRFDYAEDFGKDGNVLTESMHSFFRKTAMFLKEGCVLPAGRVGFSPKQESKPPI